MLIFEGTLGDSATEVPWYQLIRQRVFVGDALNKAYGVTALLRGFQVTYAGTDRHLQEVSVRLENYTSADNPGYVLLEASLKLRDDDPGPTDYWVTSTGEEKVSIAVDYTIILW